MPMNFCERCGRTWVVPSGEPKPTACGRCDQVEGWRSSYNEALLEGPSRAAPLAILPAQRSYTRSVRGYSTSPFLPLSSTRAVDHP